MMYDFVSTGENIMATFQQPAVYPGYDFRRKCPCKPGDTITCVVAVEAGYSDYAGNPRCVFQPGMVGIATVCDTVSVRYGPYGEDVGVNVHFTGPAKVDGNTTWRVFLRFGNIEVIERAKLTTPQAETYSKIGMISRSYGRGGVRAEIGKALERAGLATIKGNAISATIGYP